MVKVCHPWGAPEWVVAGVQAQGVLGGGSGMALLLLLYRTPSLVPLTTAPPPHFLWREGPLLQGRRDAGPQGGEKAPAAEAGLFGAQPGGRGQGWPQLAGPRRPLLQLRGQGLRLTACRSAGCRTDCSSRGASGTFWEAPASLEPLRRCVRSGTSEQTPASWAAPAAPSSRKASCVRVTRSAGVPGATGSS